MAQDTIDCVVLPGKSIARRDPNTRRGIERFEEGDEITLTLNQFKRFRAHVEPKNRHQARKADSSPVEDVDATASARALAAEKNIDLSGIEGTGKDGKVILRDVQLAVADQKSE